MRRLVAGELTLSFVPDAAQRFWRTVTRRKYQLTCNRVQLQNRLEALLEEMHLKLSSLVSDLLGPSARRMLQAIADGATDPVAVGAPRPVSGFARRPRRCADAFGACAGPASGVSPAAYRLALDELACIEAQIRSLSIRNSAACYAAIRTPCNVWRPCPAWALIRRNKSLPRSDRPPRRSRQPKRLASWIGRLPGSR